MRLSAFLDRTRRGARDRRGVTALEFGVIAPVFLLLLVGSIEAGRYIATYISVAVAANEGKRAAIINEALGSPNPSVESCAAVARQVAPATPLLNPDQLSLCILRSAENGVTGSFPRQREIVATARYTFRTFFPGLPFQDIEIVARVYAPVVVVNGRV